MFNIINSGKPDLIHNLFEIITDTIQGLEWWVPTKEVDFEQRPLPDAEYDIIGFRKAREKRDREGQLIVRFLLPFMGMIKAPSDDLKEQVIEEAFETYKDMCDYYLKVFMDEHSAKYGTSTVLHALESLNNITQGALEYEIFFNQMDGLSHKLEKWFSKNGKSLIAYADKQEIVKMLKEHGEN